MLNEDRYDAAARGCLESAAGYAELGGFARIHGSHIVVAVLEAERDALDRIFQEKLGGLRAETLEECLRDILDIAEKDADDDAPDFPEEGLPDTENLYDTATSLLQRGDELAAKWSLSTVSPLSLLAAGLEVPDPYLEEALGDVDVSSEEIPSVVEELATCSDAAAAQKPIQVFVDGQVSWSSLGPLAAEALQALVPRAARRRLRDADLLRSLLSRESRLVEALYLWGMPVSRMRARLASMTGAGEDESSHSGELREDQLRRLLRRVMNAAADMARAERLALISESHLLRAHMDSVAAGTGNIYERLGIDTRRLYEYLATHREDRESVKPEPAKQPVGEIEDIPAYLRSRVIDQEAAIERAAKALMVMRTGLGAPNQVSGKFLFLGATGVGKTELARTMAEVAFGPVDGVPEAHFIKIDCGNLMQQHHISQLLGASPEYAGYGEGGRLTNALGEKPNSVVLFDEAEKAHPSIWQSLLPLFDEGIVRAPDGVVRDARRCVLVLTSNEGYKEAAAKFNIWEKDWEEVKSEVEEFVWEHLHKYFSPEFLGRIGRENVIFFSHFRRESYTLLLQQKLREFLEEPAMTRCQIEISGLADGSGVLKMMTDMAWERRAEGARPVKRLIEEQIRAQIVAATIAEPGRTHFRFVAREGSCIIELES